MEVHTPEPDQAPNDECPIILYPPMMPSVVIRLLRELYSDAENFESPYTHGLLKKYGVWTEAPDSGLTIDGWETWSPALTEKRPGVFIRDMPYDRKQLGFDDKFEEDLYTGRTSHYTEWTGGIVILHAASKIEECRFLAWETASKLAEITHNITLETSLTAFSVGQAGDARPLKEAQMHFAAPVLVNYTSPHSWDRIPDLPKLKKIVFDVSGMIRH